MPSPRFGDSSDIYRAVDADAAEKALTAFEAGPWGQRYPAIDQSWRRAWGEVIPLFAISAKPVTAGLPNSGRVLSVRNAC